MRFAISSIALLPLALSAPAVKVESRNDVPELSVSQWSSIQSGFMNRVSELSGWSWFKADELVKSFEEVAAEIEIQAERDKTIWQHLKDDPDNFSKIVKVIEFQEQAIKYLDGDKKVTFFAPNNKALTPTGHGHHHHHHHHDDDEDKLFLDLIQDPSLTTISSLLEEQSSMFTTDDGDDDDDKKKRRREMLKKFVGKVLQYHGLMDAYSAKEIAKNSTLETALEAGDGSFGGLQRRIKVKKTLVPPGVALNFYAYIVQFDKKASNGYFHTIEKPLIPPPDLFESLYIFPDFYSTFTSAAQGLDGTDYLTWHSHHHHHEDDANDDLKEHKGTPLATVFPPTNTAFGLLPIPLKVFLFSPFGEKALEKILGYHYIPNTLLMSELMYNATEGGDVVYFQGDGGGRNYYKKFELMTVINQTVKIEVARYKTLPIDGATKTSLKINGIDTLENDVPARNGVFHPLGLPLIPPHKHHNHDGEDISAQDTWENWEEWLPSWVEA